MNKNENDLVKVRKTSAKVDKIRLSNGYDIPAIGLGCVAPFPINNDEVERTVKTAVDLGYRHFDCAYAYGTEKAVGKALNDKIDAGVVTREELFVTSKLWINEMKPDQVVPACKRSVDTMDLDYLDLYLIHFPFSDPEGADFLATWKSIEECVYLALTRSIGVSNFNINQLQLLWNNSVVKPVINQVECHVNLNQKEMRNFCHSKNVKVVAYSPLGAPARNSSYQRPNTDVVDIKTTEITTIAKKYNKSNCQVALRYLIDIGTVPIPKSSSESHLCENINIFDFKLTLEEIASLDKLDCGLRTNYAYPYKNFAEYPFILGNNNINQSCK